MTGGGESRPLTSSPLTDAPQLHAIAAASSLALPSRAKRVAGGSSEEEEEEEEEQKRGRGVMLLQGPPGTGKVGEERDCRLDHRRTHQPLAPPPHTHKTRTVLGIVSALLGTQGPPAQLPGPLASSSASTGQRSLRNEARPAAGGVWAHLRRSRRLLICAPSNGAVSEIVLRLLRDGVNGPHGEPPSAPRVVRLGSAEPEAHPLVQQSVWDTQVDAKLSQSATVKALAELELLIQQLRRQLDECDRAAAAAYTEDQRGRQGQGSGTSATDAIDVMETEDAAPSGGYHQPAGGGRRGPGAGPGGLAAGGPTDHRQAKRRAGQSLRVAKGQRASLKQKLQAERRRLRSGELRGAAEVDLSDPLRAPRVQRC